MAQSFHGHNDMEDYWQENQFWIEPTLDLIQREEFVLDTPYRKLFAKHFPRVTESGVNYECRRMWQLGRSIIENGYQPTSQIRVETKKGITRIKAGWHRARVLRALGIDYEVTTE